MSLTQEILIKNDLVDLSLTAAELFIAIARNSIDDHGRFSVALSGGSTPKALYSRLAEPKFRNSVDWAKVVFFFGDERRVPPDSKESNFRMANETLLTPLAIQPANVSPWETMAQEPTEVAQRYAREIESVLGADPRFDLILLGLGADAHTASLFPNTEALHEREKIAVANWVQKLGDFRLTLTFPLINNAANVIFLVSGSEKAKAIETVLEGDFQPDDFPAQFVIPENGHLYWLLDEPAASSLRNGEGLQLRPAET